ncbi:hypothetical protein OG339_48815 (plasmid) [Streptosporangium sp. NBC_01495]|uniref:hypothetical protein n=1 Tax=Streptosporangium sp. NBC_01495 TaxID=2903899 RepID=UPI002E3581C5|nr:hypothetical protein [Streptosporangium sp. NBC_01495]
MYASASLPVPPLMLHGVRPVFICGRWHDEERLWGHIRWIIPGEPVTDPPATPERRLPYADLAELDGQSYDRLPGRPDTVLALPPLVARGGQLAMLRRWRYGGSSWWAHLTRLTVGESAGARRAVLIDEQVAAADVAPLPGQDYRHVPRDRLGHP